MFQLLIRGMSLLVLARIGVRVTRPGRRRICGSIVFGQNALMQGLEGRPLWGRAVYTALHGARLSSVPSGDQSANPASVQGAAVSSERFSQSLPPRNVAELGSSPPLRGSLEQLDWPSPAGPPFQGTELAALVKSSQVSFIVNSSTCTVHTYRELKLRYSQTLGAYS